MTRLDEEIRAHLELLEREHRARGLSPREARDAARRDFGGVEPMKERYRDQRGRRWMDELIQDVRYGTRSLLRTPGFTAVAVLTLALGIGASTAIFSVVNGILLRPLGYAGADRLVMVWNHNTREGIREYPVSPANFFDYKASARTVEHVEALLSFSGVGALRTDSGTEQILMHSVTPGLFALLGRPAAIGRTPGLSDARIIVLSDGFWTRQFGRDPSVVGRQLTVDGQPLTVVGVMPPDFDFPLQGMLGPSSYVTNIAVDGWSLLSPDTPRSFFTWATRNVHFLSVIARLRPGATVEQAQQEALGITQRLAELYPAANTGLSANVVPLHEQAVGHVRPALTLLLAGVGFVLLIACINVTNLLLARSLARQKEMAVRTAIGATRRRLVQQALAEALLVSGAAALLGTAFVYGVTRGIVALAPPDLPRLGNIAPDGYVLLFTVLLAVATGIVAGVAPAVFASRARTQTMLKEYGRGATRGVRRSAVRAALVVGEIAAAVVLTVGGGLLVRSFVHLVAVDPGFRSEQLLTLQLTIPGRLTTPEARLAFYDEMFARLDALPDVVATGGTTRLPLGSANVSTRVAAEGQSLDPRDMPEVEFRRAVGDYFDAMGIPVVRGRAFTRADGPAAPPVVVVNEALARRLWPGEDPVGRRVRIGPNPDAPWNTVVGVVGDILHTALDQPAAPELYINHRQGPPFAPFLVVRTVGDPARVAETVRSELKALDRDTAVYDIRTMTQVRSASLATQRFLVILATVFGLLSLILAAVGVHGVMGLIVSERTQEMGIRLALGARPSGILALVLRHSLTLTAAGLALGLAGAAAVTRYLQGMLFELAPLDAATFIAASLVCVLTAMLASCVPAWRATSVDPLVAMRP